MRAVSAGFAKSRAWPQGQSNAQGRALLVQGFRCLAYWGDLWIYKQGLQQGLAALRVGRADITSQ